MKRAITAFLLAFIVLSVLNFSYYRHNVQLIYTAMNVLDPTTRHTAQEVAAADRVFYVSDRGEPMARMTLPGEMNWLVGREIVLSVVLGCALFFVYSRSATYRRR